MPKESNPCGQCGKAVVAVWRPVTGWVKMEWLDTLPVKMRTRRASCPYCKAQNDIIDIRKIDSEKYIEVTNKKAKKKPKKKKKA